MRQILSRSVVGISEYWLLARIAKPRESDSRGCYSNTDGSQRFTVWQQMLCATEWPSIRFLPRRLSLSVQGSRARTSFTNLHNVSLRCCHAIQIQLNRCIRRSASLPCQVSATAAAFSGNKLGGQLSLLHLTLDCESVEYDETNARPKMEVLVAAFRMLKTWGGCRALCRRLSIWRTHSMGVLSFADASLADSSLTDRACAASSIRLDLSSDKQAQGSALSAPGAAAPNTLVMPAALAARKQWTYTISALIVWAAPHVHLEGDAQCAEFDVRQKVQKVQRCCAAAHVCPVWRLLSAFQRCGWNEQRITCLHWRRYCPNVKWLLPSGASTTLSGSPNPIATMTSRRRGCSCVRGTRLGVNKR